MENYIVPILLQVVLIALNAIFASAEAAFLSINSARIEKIIEEGNKKTRKKARMLQKLTKDSSKFLSTIQVGITKLTAHDATAFHLVLAGAALSLIPAFILFFCLRKAINRSLEEGALIG